eukprot:TRINITY_DN25123_c0_g1_i1.p1 TRINITY_DN25123_c0_g1~~TRINITY_DN25123_c0_g1_i1.p1  ORF type:complete len:313 (+),score=45.01 TRINITY_DN25123_c0_g1_i1:39-941(+)
MDVVDKTALFGEFDPTPRQECTFSTTTTSNTPESKETKAQSNECSLKQRIIQVACASKGFFKHQQVGDPDLTKEEKHKIVVELLEQKPEIFLQRFGSFLSEDHLSYFDVLAEKDYYINFYLSEARQMQCKFVKDQRVRNRRFRAMQNMISGGDEHFSEERMRERNPLLYGQLVQKFQSPEEKAEADRPDMSNCSLTNIILDHMDLDRERELRKRLEEDEGEEEFDTDSEDDMADGDDTAVSLGEEEKVTYRKEFVQAAYRSFLEGRDSGIDYRQIDNNPSLDDLAAEDRDREEKYFDEDD